MNSNPAPSRRNYWLKTLHRWHWISSAFCLAGMLVFAATGITLNHAAAIEASPRVVSRIEPIPAALLEQAESLAQDEKKAPLPPSMLAWLADRWDIHASDRVAEWSKDEIYLSLPRPGGDAWVSIDLAAGEAEYETTDRGWVSYLNDLHKGRNTGSAWSLFIDLFAVACLIFSVTGLFLLKMHAGNRAATWPMVGLGIAMPAVLALVFIH